MVVSISKKGKVKKLNLKEYVEHLEKNNIKVKYTGLKVPFGKNANPYSKGNK